MEIWFTYGASSTPATSSTKLAGLPIGHNPQSTLWVCLWQHAAPAALVHLLYMVPTPPSPPPLPNLAGFAYGTTHSPPCGFTYGNQHLQLWFTYGAISSLTTTIAKLGWFACSTTQSPSCWFAYGAQHPELWFTYGASSSTMGCWAARSAAGRHT